MNKFVSSLLGSFVGTWIAFLLFGVVIFISGIIMIASLSLSNVSTPTAKITNNSVLRIDLNGEITERPMNKTLQEYIYMLKMTKELQYTIAMEHKQM